MTGRYILSPRAQADVDDIWDYTVQQWGEEQAEFYIRRLFRHIEGVALKPTSGRPCPEIRAGYAKYPSGAHVVFYRATDTGIDVVRILHSRMDVDQHL